MPSRYDPEDTLIKLKDSNEFLYSLKNVEAFYKELVQENTTLTPEQKKTCLETDIPQRLADLAKLLAPNLRLPYGEPVDLDSMLYERYDHDLAEEAKAWAFRSRNTLANDIRQRQELSALLDPPITQAINLQSLPIKSGVFEVSSNDEKDDENDVDEELETMKELGDVTQILLDFLKGTPQRLGELANISKMLENENE